MSISGHSDELLEQKSESKNVALEVLLLTPKQQRKQDAIELAELIYKIYNDNCPVIQKELVRKENEND